MHILERIRWLRGIAVLVCLSTPGLPALPLDVPNPSFEEADRRHTDRPLAYTTYATPGTKAEFIWDDTVTHTGSRSLSIKNHGPQTALWQTNLPCVPLVPPRIEVWAKTEKAGGETGISVCFRDEKGWCSSPVMQSGALTGTYDWTLLSYQVTPPATAKTICIFLANLRGRGGQVWFDDLSVEDYLVETLSEELPKTIALLRVTNSPLLRGIGTAEVARWRKKAQRLLTRVNQSEDAERLTLELRSQLTSEYLELKKFCKRVKRRLILADLFRKWSKLVTDPPYLLGWQDSVIRVWLRQRPVTFNVRKSKRLLAVRGEVVSTKLVIVPTSKALRGVRVSVSDFRGKDATIPASSVSIHPIPFVHITRPNTFGRYPCEITEEARCPEILLDNFHFDVEFGDSQPIWLSIRIPRGIPAGLYRSTITVAPLNSRPIKLELELELVNYELPRRWHFLNIMSLHDGWAKAFYGEAWTPELRTKFLDFLTERRINLASIYGARDFNWEEVSRAVQRGQNLILVCTLDPAAGLTEPPWLKPDVERGVVAVLEEWIPRIKKRGWLDRTYLYGFDECSQKLFIAVRNAFLRFKLKYGVQTITTARDYSYGLKTALTGAVDNFVPLMTRYNLLHAERARAKGTKVWWYTTMWNLEQPLIRSRLIPWMTFKMKADGFLIWCINRWRGGDRAGLPRSKWNWNTEPVANKILSDWNPWLDGVCPNSSANYIYPAENHPLSSTRLECFRDGIEDYDLLISAQQLLQRLTERGGSLELIEKLRTAITIEDHFIQDAIYSSYSASDLRKHRQRLLRALSAVPPSQR